MRFSLLYFCLLRLRLGGDVCMVNTAKLQKQKPPKKLVSSLYDISTTTYLCDTPCLRGVLTFCVFLI